MHKFILELFLTINGIGAMSGILLKDSNIYLISDNSNYLYEYSIPNKTLHKNLLMKDFPGEEIPKSEKKDFEAVILKDNALFIFGSGSKQNRQTSIIYTLEDKTPEEIDFAPLYKKLQEKYAIDKDNFNIEGAVELDNEYWLFNRGNGPLHKNGFFRITDDGQILDFQAITLPKIQHVQAGFTDAICVNNKIYFLAAAEDEKSNYHDGEIKGTLIGAIDAKSRKLEFTKVISLTQKFEGITLFSDNKDNIEFLLCEDADSVYHKSQIFKLKIDK